MRQILTVLCPLQELLMDADDMYWMTNSELATLHCINCFLLCHSLKLCLMLQLKIDSVFAMIFAE